MLCWPRDGDVCGGHGALWGRGTELEPCPGIVLISEAGTLCSLSQFLGSICF